MRLILYAGLVLSLVACGGDDPKKVRKVIEELPEQPEEPIELTAPDISVFPGIGKLRVEWREVQGATGYVLKRSDTETGTFTAVQTGTELAFDDLNLTSGATYYYKVNAKNANGDGPESAVKSATVLYPLAAAPATVSALASDQTARIYWAAADHAVNYQVMRVQAGVTTAVGTTADTKFTDTGLKNSAYYSYFVQALNEDAAATPSTSVTVRPYAFGRQICVSSSLTDEVHVFAADATGAGVPLRSIKGASSITNPVDVALDPGADTLFVLEGTTNDVVAFSVSSGAEQRRLHGAWSSPVAITVDTLLGVVWTADSGGTLYAYPSTDAGAGTLLRTVATTQTNLVDLELDVLHGEIFSASPTSVFAFAVTNGASLRRYPYKTSAPYYDVYNGLRAIAYVPGHDYLAVGEVQSPTYSALYTMTRCYGGDCTKGGLKSQKTTRSYARIYNVTDMKYDSSTDSVFILADAYKNGLVPPSAYKFTASGFSGTEVELTAPASVTAVALDPVNGRYWLAGDHYVRTYDLTLANLDPTGAIGSVNGLTVPRRLVSDPVNQEVYVYNAGSNAINVYPFGAAGFVDPSRSLTTTNGPAFSGEMLYVPAQSRLYAVAGTNVVAGFSRLTNGAVDLTSVDTAPERPWSMLALTYDAAGNRVVAHAQTAQYSYGFYFWNPALGTALGYANDPYSVSSPIQSLAYLSKLYLLVNLSSFYSYNVSGLTVNTGGPTIPSGAYSERTTLLHDARNNQLVLGMGGHIYTFPEPMPVGLALPERDLDVSATVGKDVSGMAFCSP